MTSSNGNLFRVTGLCAGNSPVAGEFPTQGQWRGALMFSLICAWINGWENPNTMMTSSNGNLFRVTGLCAGNSPVAGEFPTQGQWRGALMFSLICAWINGWVNNREAGDLRRLRVHYDAIVMPSLLTTYVFPLETAAVSYRNFSSRHEACVCCGT